LQYNTTLYADKFAAAHDITHHVSIAKRRHKNVLTLDSASLVVCCWALPLLDVVVKATTDEVIKARVAKVFMVTIFFLLRGGGGYCVVDGGLYRLVSAI
jgi:hypothetical protein